MDCLTSKIISSVEGWESSATDGKVRPLSIWIWSTIDVWSWWAREIRCFIMKRRIAVSKFSTKILQT